MSRKSVLLGAAISLLLVGLVAGVLLFLVAHEPAFYREALVSVPADTKKRANYSLRFLTDCANLWSMVKSSNDNKNMFNPLNLDSTREQWHYSFTQDQINSYFVEDFARQPLPGLLPDGIHEPRVVIQPDKIRLAFRYGSGFWSTVITVDLGVWLAQREVNTIAIEIQGVQAGLLPISVRPLLDRISQLVERDQDTNIRLSWYRYHGHPVALIHFKDQEHMNARFESLKLCQGMIDIQGRYQDGIQDVPAPPVKAAK